MFFIPMTVVPIGSEPAISWERYLLGGFASEPFCERLDAEFPQPERIGNHRDRAETHRRCREHGAEQDAEPRIEDSGSDRDADDVVGEGKVEILPDDFQDRAADPDRGDDSFQ